MKHGSLFSGIGGFDLASEWMGWNNIFHCEINEFCRKILHYYWSDAISYEDIKTTDFSVHRGEIDILTGGFPCQPFSIAGQRKGTEDNRYLWGEMLRAISEIQPRFILGENVYGIVTWNDGMVFEQVCADLENIGYEVQQFILPACSVNAPHRRDRVWFFAYSMQSVKGNNNGKNNGEERKIWRNEKSNVFRELCSDGTITNTNGNGLESTLQIGKMERLRFGIRNKLSNWDTFPSQPAICSGNDGISDRLDRITFSKWRKESLKGYGNAVVPQLVYEIFKTIEEFDILLSE
jgi:DNA (cytosine-5)-methyltransferase 1